LDFAAMDIQACLVPSMKLPKGLEDLCQDQLSTTSIGFPKGKTHTKSFSSLFMLSPSSVITSANKMACVNQILEQYVAGLPGGLSPKEPNDT
jgi:hypothetical protein